MLWTPGTAQIGEGVENSWGHLEDSEKEDEEEGGSDEAIVLDSMTVDTGMEVPNAGSRGRRCFMAFIIHYALLHTCIDISYTRCHVCTWSSPTYRLRSPSPKQGP